MNCYFIFLFYILFRLKSALSIDNIFNFTLSKVQELNNGNFIVLTEKGIYVFNSEFNQKINELPFPEAIEEKYFFSSFISKYPYEDTIIMIYNNTLVIYENENFSYPTNLSNEQTKNCSNLIPFKIENEKYFLLGYIKNSFFHFVCYNIIYDDSLSLNYKNTFDTHININKQNKISCNIFNSINDNNNLICTHQKDYGIINISLFYLDNNLNITFNKTKKYEDFPPLENINLYLSNNNINALVCYKNMNTQGINCFYYNKITEQISEKKNYTKECKSHNINFLKLFHSQKTKEYIFICFDYQETYTLVKFDENLNFINVINSKYNNSNYDYYGINYYSLLFLEKNNSYAFLLNFNSKNTKLYILPEKFSQNKTIDEIYDEYNLITSLTFIEQINNVIFCENHQNSSFNFQKINCIRNNILNRNINLSSIIYLDNGDLLQINNGIIYQITTTENQKNIKYNNISTIDFGECETILKN